jgi:glycosyltransferase involved in cell wall biosynthesis
MSARTVGVVSHPTPLPQNPYQRLLYEALAPHGFRIEDDGEFKVGWLVRNRRRVRVVHFHWPWPYIIHAPGPRGPLSWIKCALFGLRVLAARALGYVVVWTVHEVKPLYPRNPRVEALGARMLALGSSVLIANDRDTADKAAAELGRAAREIAVVPHPSFESAYPPGRPRAQVRAELGIPDDAFVTLLFGHVSPYKRIEWAIDAFRAGAPENSFLVVAGLVMDDAVGDAVRAAAAADDRVKARLGFVPDEQVAELYGAADAALCPRQDGGTSGVIILAFSLGVPVIAARVPNYADITQGETAAWLFEPGDAGSLAAALTAGAADPASVARKGEAGRRLVAPLTWEATGSKTAALLDAALPAPGWRRPAVTEGA